MTQPDDSSFFDEDDAFVPADLVAEAAAKRAGPSAQDSVAATKKRTKRTPAKNKDEASLNVDLAEPATTKKRAANKKTPAKAKKAPAKRKAAAGKAKKSPAAGQGAAQKNTPIDGSSKIPGVGFVTRGVHAGLRAVDGGGRWGAWGWGLTPQL